MKPSNTSLLLLLAFSAPALAQDFDFAIDPGQSTSDVVVDFSVDLPSVVIGNFDPVNNPTGTITRPGLFGGTGNQPIPMDLTFSGTTSFQGAPTGTFGMSLDTNALTLDVSGLDLDILGGSTATTDLTLSLLFQSFRTFQPTSLYIGGFPIDVPLGAQTISDALAVQSGPSTGGVLVPNGGAFDFAVAVPVDLSFVVDFQGNPTPVGPVPVVLPVVGTVTLAGGAATATFDFDFFDQQTILDPLPGFMIDDLPLDLPTILPPGLIAHLLLDATVDLLDTTVDIDVALVADGVPDCGFENYCTANANTTGLPASLSVLGSPNVPDEDLTFTVSDLPLMEFGYFLMSETQDFVPLFGGSDGNLCIGQPILRFSNDVLNSGLIGSVTFPIDFQNLPGGTVFVPGSLWNFQYWYRDGMSSNTSDGIAVQFCN